MKRLHEARKRYRQAWPVYWIDQLVERWLRQHPGMTAERVVIRGRVLAVVRNELIGAELVIPGANIVTNDGDTYYAQSAAGESPDDDFDGANSGLRLGSSNTAPTKSDTDVNTFLTGSAHALDSGYPKTDDDDGSNSGAGVDVVSWRYSYLTSEGNVSGIIEGAIVDNRTTPTAALSHFLFAASFDKTSSDTLKVFVNHTMTGE